jgi:ABC-type spermidine/putrescine transport system permease subunit II
VNTRSPRLLLPFLAAVYLGLLAPLVVVIAMSFGPSAAFEFPPRSVTPPLVRSVFRQPGVCHRLLPGEPGGRPVGGGTGDSARH